MALPTYRPKIVFPSRVDEIASEKPNRPWFSLPIDDNELSKGWKDVNFAQCARAVNRLCKFLEPRIGRSDGSSVVANVTASIDPRPQLVCLALAKLGHVGLFSAPRNTQAMHLNLFEKTNCHSLLYTDDISPDTVIGDRQMKTFELPSLSDLLDDNAPEPQAYPYTKSYEEIKDKPIAIIHTSGSTGMPKPRYLSTEWCNVGVYQAFIPPVNGRPTIASEIVGPMSHT